MPELRGLYQPDLLEFRAELGSESVTVSFDAARMTMRYQAAMQKAIDANDVDAMADLIGSVFVSWDVVDEQQLPVAMTTDLLMSLPPKVLGSLLEGMVAAAVPASEEGNVSSAISATVSTGSASSPEIHPNGQALSPSEKSLASHPPR